MPEIPQRERIDKWLWAARFFKTRTLAVQAIERGRVLLAGQRVKPARELVVGDVLKVQQGEAVREVEVLALSVVRGPAPMAQGLYRESAESVAAHERLAAARRLAPEPARALAHGRPTKRERRALDAERGRGWDARCLAALDA